MTHPVSADERDETPVCRVCGVQRSDNGDRLCLGGGEVLLHELVIVPRHRWLKAQRILDGEDGE